MRLIIGSLALEHYGLNRNTPKDVDSWVLDKADARVGDDYHVMPANILYQLMLYCHDTFANPDAVYTIKCSHLGWDIHWAKTKADILWLKAKGCKLIPDLFHTLVAHWKTENGNKDYLSLTQDKREFFNDHVEYVVDHDWLHELVAYPNRPMYESALRPNHSVMISRKKFNALTLPDRVRMFREEITVIAIERWLIAPRWKGKFTPAQAYHLALKKTIVSLTKNWATEFLATHLDLFYKPDPSYFDHALSVLEIKMDNLIGDFTELFKLHDLDFEEFVIYEEGGPPGFAHVFAGANQDIECNDADIEECC